MMIIVAVLYTLLYLVFISSLLLFGVILLVSLDARMVGSAFGGVPLYESACITRLILTRGASAQRLAFAMCMLLLLQLLPGVIASSSATRPPPVRQTDCSCCGQRQALAGWLHIRVASYHPASHPVSSSHKYLCAVPTRRYVYDGTTSNQTVGRPPA
jgi:hypothetical protein